MEWLPFVLMVTIVMVFSYLSKLTVNHLPRIKSLFIAYACATVYLLLFWAGYNTSSPNLQEFLLVGGVLVFWCMFLHSANGSLRALT